jgi:hypothetical protein
LFDIPQILSVFLCYDNCEGIRPATRLAVCLVEKASFTWLAWLCVQGNWCQRTYPSEERGTVAVLKSLEDLANALSCNFHLNRSLTAAIYSCSFASRYAGIMPIAKVLKKDCVTIRFMLQAQQNDERSAERA